MIIQEYQNTKTFLFKAILQIGLKKFLCLKKLKILFCGHVINGLTRKEIVGTFYKKKLRKTNQKEFKENVINFISNGKDIIICLIA